LHALTGSLEATLMLDALKNLINEVLRSSEHCILNEPGPESILAETRWYARAQLVLDGGPYLQPGSTDELDPLIAAARLRLYQANNIGVPSEAANQFFASDR
jgi:hypothetical protein